MLQHPQCVYFLLQWLLPGPVHVRLRYLPYRVCFMHCVFGMHPMRLRVLLEWQHLRFVWPKLLQLQQSCSVHSLQPRLRSQPGRVPTVRAQLPVLHHNHHVQHMQSGLLHQQSKSVLSLQSELPGLCGGCQQLLLMPAWLQSGLQQLYQLRGSGQQLPRVRAGGEYADVPRLQSRFLRVSGQAVHRLHPELPQVQLYVLFPVRAGLLLQLHCQPVRSVQPARLPRMHRHHLLAVCTWHFLIARHSHL